MLHCYLITAHGITHNVIHLQTLIFELKRKECHILLQYVEQHGVELDQNTETDVLRIFVGGLRKTLHKQPELKKDEEKNELVLTQSD